MQNPNILDIYFYDNIKNDADNFCSSNLRKNIKSSLELNEYRYLTNAIDERIKTVCYLNFNDLNKFNYFKKKTVKKIGFAFYSEFESDFKLFNLTKNKTLSIKEGDIKTLNGYNLLFVPSEEAKETLMKNGVKTNIETLLPPVRKTKFELKGTEFLKLVYIYFHFEENSEYIYTILDNKDGDAAKRVIEFAKIYSNLKIIVIIPNFRKREAKAVNKYFKRTAQNIYVSGILSDDIYTSLVYNAKAFCLFNTTLSACINLLEAYTTQTPVFALKDSAFSDILIDKENSYVYNDFDTFINEFNNFLVSKTPSLKENQKEFMKEHDIKKSGKRFIEIYNKYFGE